MGLLNKIKNLFMDDEIIEVTQEVEVENKIEPPKLPTFMKEKLEKEEKENAKITLVKDDKKDDDVSDRNLLKTTPDFKFPIAFDEKDFVQTKKLSSKNILNKKEEVTPKPVGQLYRNKESEVEVKKFRCTPIISPVYGILDKNYKKEEVKEKDENEYEIPRTNRKVNFEEVRKKAFGTLSDDLKESLFCEDCDRISEKKGKTRMDRLEDDLLSDIRNEETEDIDIKTAAENYYDFGVSYEVPKNNNKKKEKIEVIETEEIKPTKIDIDIDINLDKKEPVIEHEVKVIDYNNEEVEASKIEIKDEEENETIMDVLEERIDEDIEEEITTREEKNKIVIEEEKDEITIDDIKEELKEEIKEELIEELKEEKLDIEEDKVTESLELTDDLFDLIDSMYEEKENE